MHQHGVLADRRTYEVLLAEDVGRAGGQVVLGKHSGKHALRAALKSMQIEVDDSLLSAMLHLVKDDPRLATDLPRLLEIIPGEHVTAAPQSSK
jgi:isopropylmalate/homocitrate/citramalate synthase